MTCQWIKGYFDWHNRYPPSSTHETIPLDINPVFVKTTPSCIVVSTSHVLLSKKTDCIHYCMNFYMNISSIFKHKQSLHKGAISLQSPPPLCIYVNCRHTPHTKTCLANDSSQSKSEHELTPPNRKVLSDRGLN